MVPLKELTAETVLSDDVLTEVFDQEDELYKSRLLLSLEDRAGELGVKKKFQELVKAYKRVEREMRRRERDKKNSPARWSNGPILMDPMTGCSVKSGLPAREGYSFGTPPRDTRTSWPAIILSCPLSG